MDIKINPVSVAEIADIMQVPRTKVASLHYHGKLPAPDVVLKACPLWDKDNIIDFLDTVGIVDNRRKNNGTTSSNTTKQTLEQEVS